MVQYKLTYFDIRGLGETCRLILHYGGADFKDNRISGDQWGALKAKTPTGKLPILEVDGKELPESNAINRFLAAKFGLRPKDDWENAQMEAVIETYKDFKNDIVEWFRVALGRVEGDKDKLHKEIYAPAAEKFFNRLEGIISKNSNGFLANSGLSWGDLFLAEQILTLQSYDSEFTKKFPKIVEYQKHVHNHDKIKEYVSKRKESQY